MVNLQVSEIMTVTDIDDSVSLKIFAVCNDSHFTGYESCTTEMWWNTQNRFSMEMKLISNWTKNFESSQ